MFLYDGSERSYETLERKSSNASFDQKLNELNKQMTQLRPFERRKMLNDYCHGMSWIKFRDMMHSAEAEKIPNIDKLFEAFQL